jgi:hypothetical protein
MEGMQGAVDWTIKAREDKNGKEAEDEEGRGDAPAASKANGNLVKDGKEELDEVLAISPATANNGAAGASGAGAGAGAASHLPMTPQLQEQQRQQQLRQHQQKEAKATELLVRVCKATNLMKADTFGKSDPFVTLHWEGERVLKTKTIYKNLNPVWTDGNEAMITLPADGEGTLKVQVFDWDRIGSNDFLGQYTWTRAQMIAAARRSRAKAAEMKHAGNFPDGALEFTLEKRKDGKEAKQTLVGGEIFIEFVIEGGDGAAGDAAAAADDAVAAAAAASGGGAAGAAGAGGTRSSKSGEDEDEGDTSNTVITNDDLTDDLTDAPAADIYATAIASTTAAVAAAASTAPRAASANSSRPNSGSNSIANSSRPTAIAPTASQSDSQLLPSQLLPSQLHFAGSFGFWGSKQGSFNPSWRRRFFSCRCDATGTRAIANGEIRSLQVTYWGEGEEDLINMRLGDAPRFLVMRLDYAPSFYVLIPHASPLLCSVLHRASAIGPAPRVSLHQVQGGH